MKTVHIFNVDDYHQALNPIGHHRFQSTQRGTGLGGAFSIVRRYTIPVVRRYILPHVKTAAINTAVDFVGGTPIRTALKNNTANLIKDIKSDVINSLQQRGKGITRKKRPQQRTLKPVKKRIRVTVAKNKRKPKSKPKQLLKRKRTKSKLDIFS
ncbi:unnamed protein product [Orchesella dallaii]|uniref:Uncharacterized protein n=1 Tax=Orchesella dallaii TaxID=48710 RepID=A0ABP1RVF7_9HEXA